MAERNAFDRLDDVIDAILSGRAVPVVDPDLAALSLVAADLSELPDPRFLQRLRKELVPMATMTAAMSVRPYFIVEGATRLLDFIVQTFDAEVLINVPAPGGTIMHAAVRIGDSIVEMGDAGGQWPRVAPPMHVYLENAAEAYERALAAGATSLFAPMDQPYGDREAGIVDPLGVPWFLATRLENGPRPHGFGTVTPYVFAKGADRFVEFLGRAFGAVELDRTTDAAGVIRHAEVRVGESMLEVSEAHGEWGPSAGGFHLFVSDCDAMYEQAVRAGGKAVTAPANKPYGERSAQVDDEWGNQWFIATENR
jgi:PhnB protein